jgi:hypothetical protein
MTAASESSPFLDKPPGKRVPSGAYARTDLNLSGAAI